MLWMKLAICFMWNSLGKLMKLKVLFKVPILAGKCWSPNRSLKIFLSFCHTFQSYFFLFVIQSCPSKDDHVSHYHELPPIVSSVRITKSMRQWYWGSGCTVQSILLFDVYMYTSEFSTAHNFAVVGSITVTFNFRRCAKSNCEFISNCEYNVTSTAVSHLSNIFHVTCTWSKWILCLSEVFCCDSNYELVKL